MSPFVTIFIPPSPQTGDVIVEWPLRQRESVVKKSLLRGGVENRGVTAKRNSFLSFKVRVIFLIVNFIFYE